MVYVLAYDGATERQGILAVKKANSKSSLLLAPQSLKKCFRKLVAWSTVTLLVSKSLVSLIPKGKLSDDERA